MRIDLNCDLGEGAGHDHELMPLVTSANIACGGHVGDAATMRATVRLAVVSGASIGAHPGYVDRDNFGRRELNLSAGAIAALVSTQVAALQKIAIEEGATLRHVKPHGALYNQSARDPEIADAIARAVHAIDPNLILVGLAASESLRAAKRLGLTAASEVFADRTYHADGSLTARTHADALIHDADRAVEQTLRMIREGVVIATDGTRVPILADTVCLHGDAAHAVDFARRLRAALEDAGVTLRSLS